MPVWHVAAALSTTPVTIALEVVTANTRGQALGALKRRLKRQGRADIIPGAVEARISGVSEVKPRSKRPKLRLVT